MNKAFYIMILVAFAGIAAGLARSVPEDTLKTALIRGAQLVQSERPSPSQASLEEILKSNSLAVNGTLPTRFEAATLINTIADGNVFTYVYRLHEPAGWLDVRPFVEANSKQIRTDVCNYDLFYQLMLDGAEFVYRYGASGMPSNGGLGISVVAGNCLLLRHDEPKSIEETSATRNAAGISHFLTLWAPPLSRV